MTETKRQPTGTTPSGRTLRPVDKLRTLARQALEALDLELVHLVYKKEGSGWMLRLYIDREGGVTLDHCARASQQFSALLDNADIIPHTYTLEVSSPGLDRPLFSEQDYVRFAGHRAQLTTSRPLDGRRHFRGTLRGCRDSHVILLLDDGAELQIPIPLIAHGRLEAELEQW